MPYSTPRYISPWARCKYLHMTIRTPNIFHPLAPAPWMHGYARFDRRRTWMLACILLLMCVCGLSVIEDEATCVYISICHTCIVYGAIKALLCSVPTALDSWKSPMLLYGMLVLFLRYVKLFPTDYLLPLPTCYFSRNNNHVSWICAARLCMARGDFWFLFRLFP